MRRGYRAGNPFGAACHTPPREAVCPPSHQGRRLETAGDHAGVPRAGGSRGIGAVEPRAAGAMDPRWRNPVPAGCPARAVHRRTVLDPIK